jgi:multidrug efflux pump subunit AcrA (membrane-fusion protein)
LPSDLDRLRIERPAGGIHTAGSRRWGLILILVCLALAVLAALYFWGPLRPTEEVAVTVVAKVYPAQAYTVLNASGYVVAQRKAAVSSKSTGRLD